MRKDDSVGVAVERHKIETGNTVFDEFNSNLKYNTQK